MEDHNYTHGHLEILAELFYAEAGLQEAKKNIEDSIILYKKSLTLFESVDKVSKTYSEERLLKITLIKNKITDISSIS